MGRRLQQNKRHIIAAVLAACAGPALAFSPPAGCTGVLTVQYKQCMVSNIWTCENDAPGEQWVALFSDAGPFQVRKVDSEFQWLETYYMTPPRTEHMQIPAPDPENLTELFATGEDLYDFTILTTPGNNSVRYQGYDRLTGETVVIDGEPLLRTEYSYQAMGPDGTVLWSRAGNQYVSEKHRLFFFGTSWNAGEREQATDSSPVEFIYPGEPGFFPNRPIYDCGVMMSGLPDVKNAS